MRWALGDTQGRQHYLQGHLPGAVFVDLETELAGPPAPGAGRHPLPSIDQLQATARRWGLTGTSDVVVYDNSGGLAAARAWWLLRWAGVGNVRILIVAGRPGEPIPAAAIRAADEIFALALRLGGTVTGEHGIGVLKRAWLERELGPAGHELQQQLKALFDPYGILNPGKA